MLVYLVRAVWRCLQHFSHSAAYNMAGSQAGCTRSLLAAQPTLPALTKPGCNPASMQLPPECGGPDQPKNTHDKLWLWQRLLKARGIDSQRAKELARSMQGGRRPAATHRSKLLCLPSQTIVQSGNQELLSKKCVNCLTQCTQREQPAGALRPWSGRSSALLQQRRQCSTQHASQPLQRLCPAPPGRLAPQLSGKLQQGGPLWDPNRKKPPLLLRLRT